MWEQGHGPGLRALHALIALVCIFKALEKVSEVQNKAKLRQLLCRCQEGAFDGAPDHPMQQNEQWFPS